MLTQLSVANYAIAEALEIELSAGMTVLTGETGAGKSIMLDALGLALGDRADSKVIKAGADKSDISAAFDISNAPEALAWLVERDLENGQEALFRRVINKDGRSRAWINGQPATLVDTKALGALLVDIHSQHAHQSLLQRDTQRRLLDAFSGAEDTASEVARIARQHHELQHTFERLSAAQADNSAQRQLLEYQLSELEELGLTEGELDALEDEQSQLANAEALLQSSAQAIELASDADISAEGLISKALSCLDHKALTEGQKAARDMLESARISVSEASAELRGDLDRLSPDPERLQEVEQRLDTVYQLARKHKVRPESLPDTHHQLQEELDAIAGSHESLAAMEQELSALASQWHETASKLSKKRSTGAKALRKQVMEQLKALSMGHCEFIADLQPRNDKSISVTGAEQVSFLISTNPGAEPGPLNRIASGGELSRISLAISVITAKLSQVPTVVFDEVDVGIGGATAEIVGKLLRQLGENAQVLCVTHQPQVASQGHQHLRVSKISSKTAVKTEIQPLDEQQRVDEIARMLGGVEITKQTLAHAKEMLSGTG